MAVISATMKLRQNLRAAGSVVGVRRQQMPSIFRRLTKNKPGGVTIIDYTLAALLIAYAAIQILFVVGAKAGSI
jgi:hypothetical protein